MLDWRKLFNKKQQVLLKQLKQIKHMLSNIPGAVCLYQWSGKKLIPLIVSDKYSEMIGTDAMKALEETEGIQFKHVHPEDLQSLQKACLEAINQTHKLDYTYRSLNEKTGEYIWLNVQGNVIEEKGIKYAYVSYNDVTKQMTDRKKSEEWYRKQIDFIMRSYPDALGSMVMNLTQNYVTKQNRLYTFIQEQRDSRIEDYLENMREWIPEEEYVGYSKRISRDNLLDAYHKGEQEFAFDHRYQFKDKMRWVKTIVRILPNPITTDIEAYIFAVDITEQILSEQVMKKLINSRYDILALIYIEQGYVNFRYSGNEFEKIPEISIADYNKNRYASAQLFGTEQEEKYIKYTELDTIIQYLNESDHYSFNMTYVVNGRRLHKRYSYNYLSNDKDIILATVQDITRLQEKEEDQLKTIQLALAEAERANAAKTAFLSNMSHDIRTPMNAIINMTKMAMEDIAYPESVLEDLRKIDTSSSFLLSLINDVLDMAKIDSGKMELQPEVYEYKDFLNYIDSVFTPLCKNKDIKFIWNKGNTAFPLFLDKLRFNQLFFNLLSNAVKYTPPGGTVLYDVHNSKVVENELYCDFIISDTGLGMSKEFQEKMFEPFEREINRVNAQSGTGLGLAIVKSTVDMMGGTIEVDSEIGKGTKYTLHMRLPIATKEQIEEENQKRKKSEEVDLANKRILVAEDHPVNREIMKRLLSRRNVIANLVKNGQECIEALAAHEEFYYDAILMDVRMPVLDGIEATRRIRELERTDAKTIPIIALTANAFTEDRVIAEKAGMTAYLSKPVDAEELYCVLGRQIEEKR